MNKLKQVYAIKIHRNSVEDFLEDLIEDPIVFVATSVETNNELIMKSLKLIYFNIRLNKITCKYSSL